MPLYEIFFLIGVSLITLLIIFILGGFIALYTSMFFGAPYVPSNEEKRKMAKKFIQGRKRVLELGSGDGRVSIDLAEKNDRVDGFEVNPYLVLFSRWRSWRKGVSGKTHFYWKNFWRANISEYDTVYVYALPFTMNALEKKLRKELLSGAVVVSVGFRFEHWDPEKSDGHVWVYKKE